MNPKILLLVVILSMLGMGQSQRKKIEVWIRPKQNPDYFGGYPPPY
ncbi:uncharacterized protein LOC108113856 [Drosophila eugracilis]|nr:uncharacterized protein LOC108113856 [Drosophila eugracilis]